MAPIVLEDVAANTIPAEWKCKAQIPQDVRFTVVLHVEDKEGEEDMPPEEYISDEAIAAVKRGEQDYKEGRFIEGEAENLGDFFRDLQDEKI